MQSIPDVHQSWSSHKIHSHAADAQSVLQEKRERQRTPAADGAAGPAKRPRIDAGAPAVQAPQGAAYPQAAVGHMPAMQAAGMQPPMQQVLACGAATLRCLRACRWSPLGFAACCCRVGKSLLQPAPGARVTGLSKHVCTCNRGIGDAPMRAKSTNYSAPSQAHQCSHCASAKRLRMRDALSLTRVRLLGQAPFQPQVQPRGNAFLPPELAAEATPEAELYQVCTGAAKPAAPV